MVQIKTLRFFLSSNLSVSHNIKSMNLISFSAENVLSVSFKSFIGADLFALKKWERRKYYAVVSASILQG